MNRSELLPIEQEVQKQIREHFGNQKQLHFILGVSGGIDSMVLFYILSRLNISACAVHVNYQKRGNASDSDAQLVAHKAKELNLSYKIVEADPQKSEGQNFQQWARKFRYRLFEEEMRKQHADAIVVAHQQDDQIETILQKIFRGGGLASWSGMNVWHDPIFRPLLHIPRGDIEAYAKAEQVPFRTDYSNLQADFARNFLRNEWLVDLDNFFPGWKENVLRIKEQASLFGQALGWIANTITDARGIVREAFQQLNPDLQKALVLYLIKQQNPAVKISRHNLGRVQELPGLQTGQSIQLTDSFSVIRDRSYYYIKEKGQNIHSVSVTFKKDELLNATATVNGIALEVSACSLSEVVRKRILHLDAEKVTWPVTVRRWKNKDRFKPLGMEGHQLISDHLTNRKISTVHREKALVIESFEETICAVIFPPIKKRASIGTISERVKCDSGTRRCLQIKYFQ